MVHNKYWEDGNGHYLTHLFHIFEIKPCFYQMYRSLLLISQNQVDFFRICRAGIYIYISYSVIIFKIMILQNNYKQLLFKVQLSCDYYVTTLQPLYIVKNSSNNSSIKTIISSIHLNINIPLIFFICLRNELCISHIIYFPVIYYCTCKNSLCEKL